jgi:hypothetical protein
MDVPHIIAGRFRIEHVIGRGGMGTVYRATHLDLYRPVAVKVLKSEIAAYPEVAERFMREARTMAKLRHLNAAMIFDAGRLPDGRPFIVMEHVEGITLAEKLARHGRFTPDRAVQIACAICDVLTEAHRVGIVHRDLKPSNIMLGERGVCVLDFGVAKVLATSADATRTHSTTASGVIVGTPRYMSPEQCLGQTVGPQSDLYSLGVILYEMLAGRPPFIDALASAVLVKQATAPPPSLPQLCGDVPRPLAAAVHALLAKSPRQRPQTASAARALLEQSVARATRPAPEVTPFASTIAALNSGRTLLQRTLAPILIFAALGAFLLVRAATRRAAPRPRPPAAEAKPSAVEARPFVSELLAPDVKKDTLPTLDEARRAAAAASRGPVGDVRILRLPGRFAIAVMHAGSGAGRARFFVLEQQGTRYRLTDRAPLDVAGFCRARWTAETLDIDKDGYEEVLYVGAQEAKRAVNHRLVLYVPRTHEIYSLRLGSDQASIKKVRGVLSGNAMAKSAWPYRIMLQQRARSVVNNLRPAGS